MAYRNETIDDLATRLATVTAQLAAAQDEVAPATGDTQTEPATQYAFEHEDLEVVDGR